MSDNKRPDLSKSDDAGDQPEEQVTEQVSSEEIAKARATLAKAEAALAKAQAGDTAKTDKGSDKASDTVPDDEDTAVVSPRPRSEDDGAAPARRPSPAAAARAKSGTSAGVLAATVIGTLVVVALVAATITFGVLWNNKSNKLSDLQSQQQTRSAVEKVAGDYAVGAATIDYKDPTKWAQALTKGVSPDLEKKMNAAQEALTQIMTPLQWESTAELMDAVVQSESDPMYTVNAYVRVNTRTVQAADGRSSIVAYELTIKHDGDKWVITDVGGNALGTSGQSPAAPATPSAAPGNAQPTGQAPAPAPAPGN